MTTLATEHLQLDNNQLAQALYGQHNSYLQEIERIFSISIIAKGNHLTLKGKARPLHKAVNTINALYSRLEADEAISRDDVLAACRHADKSHADTLDAFAHSKGAIKTRRKVIAARSPKQGEYLDQLAKKTMVFGLGPAGTGKTYLAVAKAVEQWLDGRVKRIILSRPAVEAGEQLGFLPGDMKMKIDPYLRPLYDALYDMLPMEQVEKMLEAGDIEIAPLAFMRGRTLSNAFVILDEAQNATHMQLKMLLTRLGEHARMVITGDLTQIDLPPKVQSGLPLALKVANSIDDIGVTEFDDKDVVRHPLVGKIVTAYNKFEA